MGIEDDLVPINRRIARHDSEQCDFSAVKHVRQNVLERFRIPGHFQRDIKAFFHPELLHRVRDVLASHVQGEISVHFSCEIETVRIYISDDDMPRACAFADWNCHATDRPSAGDEHIFSYEIERERCVHRIAEWIKTRKYIKWD